MPRRLFSRRWSPFSPTVPTSPENTPVLGLPPFPPLCSSSSCGVSVSQINSAPGTRPHGGTLTVPGTRGRDGGLSPGRPGFPVTPFRPCISSPRGRLHPLLGSVPHARTRVDGACSRERDTGGWIWKPQTTKNP